MCSVSLVLPHRCSSPLASYVYASVDELLAAKVLRLDFQRIPAIDNLEVFTNVTDLYLQHVRHAAHSLLLRACWINSRWSRSLAQNRIRVIENLDFLTNLKFLVLSNNKIEQVRRVAPVSACQPVHASHCISLHCTDPKLEALEECRCWLPCCTMAIRADRFFLVPAAILRLVEQQDRQLPCRCVHQCLDRAAMAQHWCLPLLLLRCHVCTGELPESLSILNLQGNPCCEDAHYRLQLVLNLKNLTVWHHTWHVHCGKHNSSTVAVGAVASDARQERGPLQRAPNAAVSPRSAR